MQPSRCCSGERTMMVLLLIVLLCRSEAFATPFLGQRLRGGAATPESTASSTPLTCVMQAPPSIPSSSSSSDFEQQGPISSSWNNNNNKKTNGFTVSRKKQQLQTVEFVAETKLPTDLGLFQLRAYRHNNHHKSSEPCIIYNAAKPPTGSNVPVRIHDQCLTSEVFRSQRCDCKEQLTLAMKYVLEHGGCIIYLQQEGRGIGFANKIAAYSLQDVGFDTVDANLHLGFPEDMREYGVVPSMLQDLGITSIVLLTNNPRKVLKLEQLGIRVTSTIPMVVPANPHNHKYLMTKRDRMNHSNLQNLAFAPRKQQRNMVNGKSIKNNVQVDMIVEDTDHNDDIDETELGVVARDDGYCFGRQSVEDAIEAIANGEMIVVVDDMNRENEGDFIMAADQCKNTDMAKIVQYSSGVVCVAMPESRLQALELPPMVTNNEDPKGTAFTVSVDATKEHGITTGISATDRARTVQMLANPESTATDFHRPGHLFPLRAMENGVLDRNGHTEAAVDFCKLAGRQPCGILCEIVSQENPVEMMRLPEMKKFAKQHGYVLTSIADLIQYRRETGQ